MAAKEYPLSLVIRAVDKLSGPLRAMTATLNRITDPARKLGKDFSKFGEAAGLKQAFQGISGFGGALKNVGGEVVNLGLRLFALASVAGVALFGIIRGAVDAGDQLAKMADRVGLGVDSYASLQHAAELADIEQEEFNSGLDKFSKNLGEAKANGGPLLDFLKKVSPALGEQVKNSKNVEQGLSLMTDAFVRLQDPQKRAALATAAFGKSGAGFGNFFHQGSDAIQKQQIEYLRLAGSQEEFARNSSDLDDALRNSETAFLGLRSAAAGALFPAITALTKGVTEFIVKNRDGIGKWAKETGAALQKWIDGGGIERTIAGLKDLADTGLSFVDKVGGLKTILIAIGVVMAGPLIAAILGVIPAIYALGAALLTTPVGWFILAVAAIAFAVYEIYEHWDGIKDYFKDLFAQLKGIYDNGFAGIVLIIDGLVTSLEGLLTLDFDKVMRGWSEQLDGFKTSLVSILGLLQFVPGGSLATQALVSSGILGSPLGASSAAPVQSLQSTQASVSVDFKNVPRGVSVTQGRNSSQPVDLSLGYSNLASY